MLNKNLIENYIINNENKLKINSNEIANGDIFLALQGNNYHGNQFIESSINNGAKFCLTDKKNHIPSNSEKIVFVENIFFFLSDLVKKKRKLFKGKVIGITGSAGKTTLKEALSFFLRKKYKVSSSDRSYNNFLGVILTILNMNLKAKFAVFELGTNNFGEIKKIVQLVLPSQVIITNIQSTHLANFKNKRKIAIEKSDIFNPKYNPNIRSLIFLNINKEENLLLNYAHKYQIKKIITIGQTQNSNCYISEIKKKNNKYLFNLIINKKNYTLTTKTNILHRIRNIIFCLALFNYNKLGVDIILKNFNKLKPVVGRGLIYAKKINNKKIKFIDETYNANPDTMKQSIEYFHSMKTRGFDKILILGNMNELGKHSEKFHLEILRFIEKFKFHCVILCSQFFQFAVSKIEKPSNKYIFKKNENDLIEYIKSDLHKNALILAKCSNSTSVNKFGIKFINMKGND